MYIISGEIVFLYNSFTLKNEFYIAQYTVHKNGTKLGTYSLESNALNGSDEELLMSLGNYTKPNTTSDGAVKIKSLIDLLNKLTEEGKVTLYTWYDIRKDLGDIKFSYIPLKEFINPQKLNLQEYYRESFGKDIPSNSVENREKAITELVLSKYINKEVELNEIISDKVDGI